MKFRIEVCGKDSVSEGVSKATAASLKAKGVRSADTDGRDEKFEKEAKRLEALVSKYLIDGEGGSDAVVVEFDTDAKTCVVVPVSKARRGD